MEPLQRGHVIPVANSKSLKPMRRRYRFRMTSPPSQKYQYSIVAPPTEPDLVQSASALDGPRSTTALNGSVEPGLPPTSALLFVDTASSAFAVVAVVSARTASSEGMEVSPCEFAVALSRNHGPAADGGKCSSRTSPQPVDILPSTCFVVCAPPNKSTNRALMRARRALALCPLMHRLVAGMAGRKD